MELRVPAADVELEATPVGRGVWGLVFRGRLRAQQRVAVKFPRELAEISGSEGSLGSASIQLSESAIGPAHDPYGVAKPAPRES